MTTPLTTPESSLFATPVDPARANRSRVDTVLGLAARLVGFAAVLGSLAFAAWGWVGALLH